MELERTALNYPEFIGAFLRLSHRVLTIFVPTGTRLMASTTMEISPPPSYKAYTRREEKTERAEYLQHMLLG